jgi:hypothetical protein
MWARIVSNTRFGMSIVEILGLSSVLLKKIACENKNNLSWNIDETHGTQFENYYHML